MIFLGPKIQLVWEYQMYFPKGAFALRKSLVV